MGVGRRFQEDHTVKSDAIVSDCGKFRYWLTRDWDSALPRATFIMLKRLGQQRQGSGPARPGVGHA